VKRPNQLQWQLREPNAFILGLLILVVTFCLYIPATRYGFVNFDDEQYVYENPWVNQGLSVDSVKWAFSSTHAANWHPLTWISHMADSSLWGGLNAGGHHLTNILLHSLNALLLFLLLKCMTQRLWPSWLAAALFAWHPLHVESVAWVAERKDLLSTLFLLLTIWAYAQYVHRRAINRYVLALALFALGLLCKPMIVTLPCLLLLLDYWPLRRCQPSTEPGMGAQSTFFRLAVEKLPFLALSLAASVVTIIAQHSGGAIKTFDQASLSMRLVNSVAAYGWYVVKMLVPANLCVFYPLPPSPPYAAALGSGIVLAGLTWIAIRFRHLYPWLPVGWFWFLGALVPVIGLVQVGGQAVADRYTYVPLIGLFIIFSWSLGRWIEVRPSVRPWIISLTGVLLLSCLVATSIQLRYWQSGIPLFTRVLEVNGDSAFAQNSLGVALSNAGRGREAIPHYLTALRFQPDSIHAHYNLGVEYADVGDLDHAAEQFYAALKISPRSESLHNNLGVVLAKEGQVEKAVEQFKAAIDCNPTYPKSYLNYARALEQQGQFGLAITNYNLALQRDPNSPEIVNGLANLFATCTEAKWRNPPAAVQLAGRANAMTQFQVSTYVATLAAAYAAAGDYAKAAENADLARRLAEAQGMTDLAAKLQTDLESYKARLKSEVQRDSPPK
jgi:tetratricopeptide (TPR) repeat protein